MKDFLIAALVLLVDAAVTWALLVGAIWLISLCFGLQFNIAIASGVWLVFRAWKRLVG